MPKIKKFTLASNLFELEANEKFKALGFFRGHERKKWPLGAGKSPEIHPQPPFLKGGRGGIFRDWATSFLLTDMFVLMRR